MLFLTILFFSGSLKAVDRNDEVSTFGGQTSCSKNLTHSRALNIKLLALKASYDQTVNNVKEIEDEIKSQRWLALANLGTIVVGAVVTLPIFYFFHKRLHNIRNVIRKYSSRTFIQQPGSQKAGVSLSVNPHRSNAALKKKNDDGLFTASPLRDKQVL